MDYKTAIDLVMKKGHTWKRVNDQPCMHTFHGRYYINICAWNNNGKPTISIDIDDYRRGINNIININISESADRNYKELLRVYKEALHLAIPA